MQLTVQLIQLLPLQLFTRNNGPWKKQDIIFEYKLEGEMVY